MVTTANAFPRTANDRLKEGFDSLLALSFMAATLTHLLVFQLSPTMSAPTWDPPDPGIQVLDPLDPIDLPPAPEPIARPRMPVASATVSPETTIDPVAWSDVVTLPRPEPAAPTRTDPSAIPFTPFDVAPRIANPAEVRRVLERTYPPLLRDAGVAGTVVLLVHIDAQGRVLEARVGASSGIEDLDAAALRAVDTFRFHPAMNRDLPTAVWTRVPVRFEVR